MSTDLGELAAVDAALSAFGSVIGLPDLGWDEARCCSLQFDEVTVNLEHVAEEQQIYVLCRLGQAPGHEGDRLAVYQKLLEWNCFYRGTGGGVIGVDGGEGGIILSHRISVANPSGERLAAFIEEFLQVAETLRGELGETPAADSGTPGDAAPASGIMTLRV